MARKPIDQDDPLVSKQFSIPVSMTRELKRASDVSRKSAAQIVREALAVELAKSDYNSD